MTRFLHRPMFRIGGSAGGITSGLRRGFAFGSTGPQREYLEEKANEEIVDDVNTSADSSSGLNKIQAQLSLIDQLAPQPDLPKSTAGADFLMDLGLNLMSGPSTGTFWGNVGEAGKDPLQRFQKARMAEKAMKYQQGADRRGLVADLVSKGLDEKTLSDIDRKVDLWKKSHVQQPGESDEDYNDRAYGEVWETFEFSKSGHVRPEEVYDQGILFQMNLLAEETRKPSGEYIKKVAEHKYKIQEGLYEKEILSQLATDRNSWMNHSQTSGDVDISVKPTVNDDGEIVMYKMSEQMKPFWKSSNGQLTYDYKTGNLYRVRITDTDAFFELVPDPNKE